jgi:hypothetical protein
LVLGYRMDSSGIFVGMIAGGFTYSICRNPKRAFSKGALKARGTRAPAKDVYAAEEPPKNLGPICRLRRPKGPMGSQGKWRAGFSTPACWEPNTAASDLSLSPLAVRRSRVPATVGDRGFVYVSTSRAAASRWFTPGRRDQLHVSTQSEYTDRQVRERRDIEVNLVNWA